jgi:hypothetical protein
MKAKEALLAAGRIKEIGRGRISLDNHAWLKAEYDKGVRFSDWPKGEVVETATPDGAAEVRVVRDPAQSNEKVISEFTILYEKDLYVAIGPNKEEYGMAEVCNNCRVSLVQNHCEDPIILGHIPVTITPRS